MINSILGTVRPDELGRVLMHEHIVVHSPEIELNYPRGWDANAVIADAVQRLHELKAVGFDSLVDLTVVPMGRNLPMIREIAASAPINVIVATGAYVLNHIAPALLPLGTRDAVRHLADLFVRDIREGSAATGIRAGVIKCATDADGLTPDVITVLRASATAHRETGVPISTHSSCANRSGLMQQQVFTEMGVDLSRVVIGHCGDTNDHEYLVRLMSVGSTIGMDRFGLDAVLPMHERVDVIAALCAGGFADRMVLSHDAACSNDWIAPRLAKYVPNWNYTHIARDVVPALLERGVSQADIDAMLIHNPARILTPTDPY